MPTAGSCYPIHMFNRYYNTFFSYIDGSIINVNELRALTNLIVIIFIDTFVHENIHSTFFF
ncbi:hypothetical protein BK734_14055 [Bacillus thuringiensis serovar kim]|nr:hypothetical protein BK734_14055 [Bacillus thuringiensis serovar kim]